MSAIGALLVAVVGWLLSRGISQIDETMKGLSADHRQLTEDLQEVKVDLQAAKQLREFHEDRLKQVEQENRAFRRYFSEVDRLIYRRFGESVQLREE
ncbi:hypothetical protein Q5H89_15785 [Hymenobacter sp. CA2-7]|nr:hypothetical protein [Hymenobacter sp. CA2-7]